MSKPEVVRKEESPKLKWKAHGKLSWRRQSLLAVVFSEHMSWAPDLPPVDKHVF